MTLHPPGNRRERILAYGGPGSGKSSAWLNIAEWLERGKSEARVRVLDTDFAWEAYRPVDGHLDERVVVETVWDWEDMLPAMDRMIAPSKSQKPPIDDWLVVDMADKPWEKARKFFFESLSDKDFGEFMLDAVKKGINIGGEWGANWSAINTLYGGFTDRLVRWRGHLLCATPATEVRVPDRQGKGGDSADVRETYGRLGMKPQGQKDLPHLFHSVLYMQEKPGRGGATWVMSTAKDRQREIMKGEEVGQFVMSYLIQRAGWRP